MFDKFFEVLIRVIVMFIAFPVHESAHALVAYWLGDDTGKNEKRISLNPFRHMNLFGALMMVFIGVGWAKPVPINPNKFKNRKFGMALSSLAGPVSNLLLAYISIVLWRILYWHLYMNGTIVLAATNAILTFLEFSVVLNIGLAVFNLLPIPPLDGSRIITLILPEETYFKIMKYERIIFIGLIITVYSGLLDKPLMLFREGTLSIMLFLSKWVDLFFI